MPAKISVPQCLQSFDLISGGATGWIFKIQPGIALKYSVGDGRAFQRENDAYDFFEQQRVLLPCPFIVQSFLRLPGINFMALMKESLKDRIQQNQHHDEGRITVSRLEPISKIQRWATELAEALSWLEGLGFVHGDLRPANVLLDHADHIKLADFDSIAKIGTRSPGNSAPWSREVGDDHPEERSGTHGLYGPRTEQFAFGSILYNLTHGHEPYEGMGREVIPLLQKKIFPELSNSALDNLTKSCWQGTFKTIADLRVAVVRLDANAHDASAAACDEQDIHEMRTRCQELLHRELAGVQPETRSESSGNVEKESGPGQATVAAC